MSVEIIEAINLVEKIKSIIALNDCRAATHQMFVVKVENKSDLKQPPRAFKVTGSRC